MWEFSGGRRIWDCRRVRGTMELCTINYNLYQVQLEAFYNLMGDGSRATVPVKTLTTAIQITGLPYHCLEHNHANH